MVILSQITEHIGQRIRLYRKNKRMTQDEFAAKLHKSKSAISKYEGGDIAIDIDTLYEIADILDVSINQLLDYSPRKAFSVPGPSDFFGAPGRLYTYYLNKNNSRIVKGILEINRTDDCDFSTVFYADLQDYGNPYACNHLYYGDIHYSDTYVNMVLQNQANGAERVYMNVANPFHVNASFTTGMISGISGKYLVPIALKVVVSRVPLQENEDLRGALYFGKEDFRRMKQTFCFSVERLASLHKE